LRAEHKRHAFAVYHDLILSLFFDSVEELPEADIWTDSEVTLAKSHEFGEEEKGIGAYVVRLEAISAKH
jgi:hypothetical protein